MTRSPPPTWVVFDVVGTLLYADPPVGAVYRQIGQEFGSLRAHEIDLEPRFRQAFAALEQQDLGPFAGWPAGLPLPNPQPAAFDLPALATCEARELDRWRRIVARVFDDLAASDRFEPCFQALWKHFAQPGSWRWFDDVAPVCAALVDRGFRLALASNYDSRLRTLWPGLPRLPGVEQLLISSELQARKPSLAFFRAVERTLHAAPHQLLMVGDDWLNDIQGAQAAGWSAAWLTRHRPHPQAPLHNLSQLLTWLAG